MRTYFSYLIIIVLGSSCIAYKPISTTESNIDTGVTKAFVLNQDDYRRAGRILKYSKRYDLDSDSLQADVFIELKGISSSPGGCVTPQAAAMVVTLGFYPVRFRETYCFEYDEIRDSTRTARLEFVEIERVFSWFHLLSPRKSRNRAIGKAMNG